MYSLLIAKSIDLESLRSGCRCSMHHSDVQPICFGLFLQVCCTGLGSSHPAWIHHVCSSDRFLVLHLSIRVANIRLRRVLFMPFHSMYRLFARPHSSGFVQYDSHKRPTTGFEFATETVSMSCSASFFVASPSSPLKWEAATSFIESKWRQQCRLTGY